MIGFIDTVLVYTPAPSGGNYTVLAATLTSCRLAQVAAATTVGTGRVEIEQVPRLLWTDAYDMPNAAQIEVAGVRYNVRAGTYTPIRGPSGAVMYRRCDVVKP